MVSISCLVIFVHFLTAVTLQEVDFNLNSTREYLIHDSILCRHCGNDITYSSSIINKTSPSSRFSFYDIIFDKEVVLVQVLTSDSFVLYPVITASQSNCVGIAEWEEADVWFPGYRWRPCVCPDCGAFIGWAFHAIDSNLTGKPENFFGLILSSLVGESFTKSLTIQPAISN